MNKKCFSFSKRKKTLLYLNIYMHFLTFLLHFSSRQQSVEDVVVSFPRVLSHNSILQKNQCSKAKIISL